MKFDMKNSVTRQEALSLMREHWTFSREQELVSLKDCLGRVTAEDIFSHNTLPVFRASCFDGVAVRSTDFQNGMPDTSAWVKGRDFVRADTGDDFPDAFDTVIAIEDVILEGEGLRFADDFVFDSKEETVDPAGTIVRSGALLVPAHTRITPELMASLAMGGVTEIPVIRQMKVAFIPTGSELIPVGQKPERGQNVETNGLMLSGLLSQRGAQVICLPIVRDDVKELEAALDQALSMADMVLINGGSSRGEEDYNSHLLKRRSSFFRHGVRAVPGRPVAFSIIDEKPVINVPGPVAAAYLAEHWCLSALVCHYYGLPAPQYPVVSAVLDQPVKKRPGFELIARVALRYTAEQGYIATPVSWGDDGIPGFLLETDGFLNVPADTNALSAGDTVEVELLKTPELIKGRS
ncbi:MAG: molybdopterin molybdotransferase MoeA [Lachnospiraceae bacterium]|nr:molybdopterin molybdotransferase MoeA [Lachnospiraceae bacterium]MDY4971386.1 molybdopterin molybdotransferase MoeA [Lachnospiraceae bacterium]